MAKHSLVGYKLARSSDLRYSEQSKKNQHDCVIRDQLLSWLGAGSMILAIIYLWIVSISGSNF